MKKAALFFFLLATLPCFSEPAPARRVSRARGIVVAAGYRYQFAPEWDRIVQVYNFTRPWNAQPLPFLASGFDLRAGYEFYPWRSTLSWGFSGSYQHTRASVKNNGTRFSLALHSFEAGVSAHVYPASFFNHESIRFGITFDPAVALLLPTVRLGGKPVQLEEDKNYHPLSVAFRMGVTFRYDLVLGKGQLSPLARFSWYPNAELFDFASAVNGSYFGNVKDESPVYAWSVGAQYVFRLNEKNVDKLNDTE